MGDSTLVMVTLCGVAWLSVTLGGSEWLCAAQGGQNSASLRAIFRTLIRKPFCTLKRRVAVRVTSWAGSGMV